MQLTITGKAKKDRFSVLFVHETSRPVLLSATSLSTKIILFYKCSWTSFLLWDRDLFVTSNSKNIQIIFYSFSKDVISSKTDCWCKYFSSDRQPPPKIAMKLIEIKRKNRNFRFGRIVGAIFVGSSSASKDSSEIDRNQRKTNTLRLDRIFVKISLDLHPPHWARVLKKWHLQMFTCSGSMTVDLRIL